MTTQNYNLKMGSLFAGIGGFELGIEKAMPFVETVWQCEQDDFCQHVLKHHWPNATMYDDVRDINNDNAEPIDILCGGFPCQDISVAGAKKGIVKNETRSGLWWEMHRIISVFRPSIVFMENVSAISFRGLDTVTASLAQIGYVCEWQTLRASDMGAPHQRERWFAVAYTNELYEKTTKRLNTNTNSNIHSIRKTTPTSYQPGATESSNLFENGKGIATIHNNGLDNLQRCKATPSQSFNTNVLRLNKEHGANTVDMGSTQFTHSRDGQTSRIQSADYQNGWKGFPTQSPVCRRNDGLSYRPHGTKTMGSLTINRKRLKALGNAIVPQCAQIVAQQVLLSGLIETIQEIKNENY